jgi:hypothetical protein
MQNHRNIYKKQLLSKIMINPKELSAIILASMIIAFSLTIVKSSRIGINFLITLGLVFLVIAINVLTKKITAYYYESRIEVKIWEIQRYGFKPHQKLKKPFPAGLLVPLVSTIFLFPLKGIIWMSSLMFEIKPEIYNSAKRHGIYSFSEIPESQIGLIACSGIIINLVFAILGYLIGSAEFSKLNLYYAFFNLIPVSNLDGNKIFFGNLLLWSILGFISLIGLGYTFIL